MSCLGDLRCQSRRRTVTAAGSRSLEGGKERVQFRQGRSLRRLQPLHCVYLQGELMLEGKWGDWNNKLLDDLHVKSRHDSTTLSNTEPMQDMRMQEKARMEVGRQALSMVERDAA